MLQDFNFSWLSTFSSATDEETKRMALKYLIVPCGIVRGVLANLGLVATVNADVIAVVPSCQFSIKVKSSNF